LQEAQLGPLARHATDNPVPPPTPRSCSFPPLHHCIIAWAHDKKVIRG
jgi:hypothetical protein